MEHLQTIQTNPLFNIARPRLEKAGAGRLAAWLNRRRRKRLGIPEPVPEGCPPVDFTPADCPPQRQAGRVAFATGLIGLALGVAAGFFIAQQQSAE